MEMPVRALLAGDEAGGAGRDRGSLVTGPLGAIAPQISGQSMEHFAARRRSPPSSQPDMSISGIETPCSAAAGVTGMAITFTTIRNGRIAAKTKRKKGIRKDINRQTPVETTVPRADGPDKADHPDPRLNMIRDFRWGRRLCARSEENDGRA